MPIRKILVPVDYSDGSKRALEVAADLARTNGAMLEIVHVWDRPLYVPEGVTVRHADGSARSLLDMIRENAELEMDTFLAKTNLPSDIRYERRLIAGEPVSRILEELGKGRFELVTLGTHGRTGLRHFLLGSVAEKIVRLSPVPVLTVPPAR
jgi:nucleotide-binding universal stress UspA family protein